VSKLPLFDGLAVRSDARGRPEAPCCICGELSRYRSAPWPDRIVRFACHGGCQQVAAERIEERLGFQYCAEIDRAEDQKLKKSSPI
jgi:hypothetical protein